MPDDSDAVQVKAGRVRLRATKRKVSSHSVKPDWHDVSKFEFTEPDQHRLLIPLAIDRSDEAEALAAFQDLADTYNRWRKTPQSSREIAKRDLLRLANYCDKYMKSQANNSARLVQTIESLDNCAESLLWKALRERQDWPTGQLAVESLYGNPNPFIIAEAARSAALKFRGGDYPDNDLYAIISGLIDVFECVTGKTARAGRKDTETPICMVAYAFFDIIREGEDETVSRTSIWNSLDKELRARRKKAHSTEGTS